MLSKPTIYDEFRPFLEQQISFQKWRSTDNLNQGKGTESQNCCERARMFERLLERLRAETGWTEPLPVAKKQASSKPSNREPSNREMVYQFLKTGPATMEALGAHAVTTGRSPYSVVGTVYKMVREGELSRTGSVVDVVVKE